MSKGNILVVGGAGYVGSHTCLALATAGYTPIVFDNFYNGHKEFVQWGPLVEGDIRDPEALKNTFRTYDIKGVLHFAALIEVGFSVKDPAAFYENNVGGAVNIIKAAEEAGVQAFVFSSTCATYGAPEFLPMDETHVQKPLNPYGQSKLMVEQVLKDMRTYKDFSSVALRYFNAAGADPESRIGEWHDPETHAIPLLLDVAYGAREKFFIFGSDYETRDGTCIRDYIHVLDLADAHVRALELQLNGSKGGEFNLGTGTGTTVRELIDAAEAVTGKSLTIEATERRDGDSPSLVANNAKASAGLGWTPERNLQVIIEDAWRWHRKLKGGLVKN